MPGRRDKAFKILALILLGRTIKFLNACALYHTIHITLDDRNSLALGEYPTLNVVVHPLLELLFVCSY